MKNLIKNGKSAKGGETLKIQEIASIILFSLA